MYAIIGIKLLFTEVNGGGGGGKRREGWEEGALMVGRTGNIIHFP